MNNFFFDSSDYAVFKKAYRATRNEPVVINILSSDSSLKGSEDPNKVVKTERKNMSNRYQPNSPFGRFFGPRKPDSSPVDMKDFSSWKNKNYRKIEENLSSEEDENKPKFSLSEYLKNRNKNKYQNSDETTINTQKPVTQLSSSEPAYKKFFLDRYMNNIEQETKVKNEFEKDDDLLAPLGEDTERTVADSSQDEDFAYSTKFDVEDVVYDNNTIGDKYRLEIKELDAIKNRLDMIEKRNQEEQKPKEEEKPVYTIDEEEEVAQEESKVVKETTVEKVEEVEEPEEVEEAEDIEEDLANYEETESISTKVKRASREEAPVYEKKRANDEDDIDRAEMQAKLDELIDQNRQADEKYEQSRRNADLEKQKVAEEYELKIRELEESYKKHVEEIKQQSYLEKLERDAKLDEVQSKISMRERELSERERASLTMMNSGMMLNQELKSNLDISNLEMDKKLLEMISDNKDIDLDVKKLSTVNVTNNDEKSTETKKRKTSTASKSSKSSSKTSAKIDVSVDVPAKKKRKRKKRRRIDSDIVTNYNFD